MNVRNVARLLALAVVFASFVWFVGNSHRQEMAKTKALLDMGAADGPVLVDHSVCRYLLPAGNFDAVLNQLFCNSCVSMAEEWHTHFEIAVHGGSCAQSGTNAVTFKSRSAN